MWCIPSVTNIARILNPIKLALQEGGTATVLPIDTETSTSEPTITPKPQVENVSTIADTPAFESMPTATPSNTATLAASSTPISSRTSTSPTELPGFSVEFSATPDQGEAGTKVAFTLKIVNDGKSSMIGLRFSNILPADFNYISGDPKGFDFDTKTRELTWTADKDILPGDNLELHYIAIIESEIMG